MSALNRFRKYTCDVYRIESQVINGITKHAEILKYSDVPCHLSQGKPSVVSSGEVPAIETSDKVFFDAGADILPGDKLVIKFNGSERKYTAGKPFYYSRHIEVAVTGSEKA
jgi:hypothetical protein